MLNENTRLCNSGRKTINGTPGWLFQYVTKNPDDPLRLASLAGAVGHDQRGRVLSSREVAVRRERRGRGRGRRAVAKVPRVSHNAMIVRRAAGVDP